MGWHAARRSCRCRSCKDCTPDVQHTSAMVNDAQIAPRRPLHIPHTPRLRLVSLLLPPPFASGRASKGAAQRTCLEGAAQKVLPKGRRACSSALCAFVTGGGRWRLRGQSRRVCPRVVRGSSALWLVVGASQVVAVWRGESRQSEPRERAAPGNGGLLPGRHDLAVSRRLPLPSRVYRRPHAPAVALTRLPSPSHARHPPARASSRPRRRRQTAACS